MNERNIRPFLHVITSEEPSGKSSISNRGIVHRMHPRVYLIARNNQLMIIRNCATISVARMMSFCSLDGTVGQSRTDWKGTQGEHARPSMLAVNADAVLPQLTVWRNCGPRHPSELSS